MLKRYPRRHSAVCNDLPWLAMAVELRYEGTLQATGVEELQADMDKEIPITASATLASELMFEIAGDDRVRAA